MDASTLMDVLYSFLSLKYCNDPQFEDRQVWANSVDSDHTAVWSESVLFYILWTQYSMVKLCCSNFQIISAIFSGVQIFQISILYFTTWSLQIVRGDITIILSKTFNCDIIMVSLHVSLAMRVWSSTDDPYFSIKGLTTPGLWR